MRIRTVEQSPQEGGKNCRGALKDRLTREWREREQCWQQKCTRVNLVVAGVAVVAAFVVVGSGGGSSFVVATEEE